MNFRLYVYKNIEKEPLSIVDVKIECEYGVVLQALATFMDQVGGSHEEKRNWDDIERFVDDRVRRFGNERSDEPDKRPDSGSPAAEERQPYNPPGGGPVER